MTIIVCLAIGFVLGKVSAEQWGEVWANLKTLGAWLKSKVFKPKAPK